MKTVTLGGNAVTLTGNFPQPGEQAPDFKMVGTDLNPVSLNDYVGKNLILNIFPSIDTSVCATSVRKFNERAASLDGVSVLCISRDLPFAQKRFCGAEGIENVQNLSDFKDGSFGKAYGVEMTSGIFDGLHARAIVVVGGDQKVIYSELVENISSEPDYEKAIAAATNGV